jgi:hypothetical protein
VRYFNGWRIDALNQPTHVAQATGTLRVTHITGTLSGVNTPVDVVNNSHARLRRGSANISHSIVVAVMMLDVLV